MKTPSTVWLPRSPVKFRRMRGEYWLDPSCSATIVNENAIVTTVIIVPAIVDRTPRAPAEPPSKSHHVCRFAPSSTSWSNHSETNARMIAPSVINAGRNQRLSLMS